MQLRLCMVGGKKLRARIGSRGGIAIALYAAGRGDPRTQWPDFDSVVVEERHAAWAN
jgi:hypothetical protein